MTVDERDVSLTDALCDLALLPLRLVGTPLAAMAPPEAREHMRTAYQETRAAARSLMPSLGRRRTAKQQPTIIVE